MKKGRPTKLSIEQDLFICLKAGISGLARRTIKSELIKLGMDLFAATGAIQKKKKELIKNGKFEWVGEGDKRALVCTDIRAVLEGRFAALVANNMLCLRRSGTVSLVLTGDKGGIQGGTKIGIVLADVAHPNSPSNVTLVGYYIGDDNRF